MVAPRAAPAHQGPPSPHRQPAPAPTAAIMDPMKPSQDFLGDTRGAMGCLPRVMPANQPPVSLAAGRAMSIRTLPTP